MRNAGRMALSCLCIWCFCIYSHLQCLKYTSFGSRRVLSWSCCCILLRKQVCGLAKHVYAKSHWLKGPSPVSCPIGGKSTEIEGNPSLYILWIKFKFWVPWSERWMFQEWKLCMFEALGVHTDWVLNKVWEREKIKGRNSISGPQKFELHEDLCLAKVFD
jgi:hypothetical protein